MCTWTFTCTCICICVCLSISICVSVCYVYLFVCVCVYNVHKHHHVMMCIGNRLNFALILNNFDNVRFFRWFYQTILNYVEYRLSFTWAFTIWGFLCGSVAHQYIWNLLSLPTFSSPVLRRWLSPWSVPFHYLIGNIAFFHKMHCVSPNNPVRYYDKVWPRKWPFIKVIIVYPFRGTQLATEIWRLTSWILFLGPS